MVFFYIPKCLAISSIVTLLMPAVKKSSSPPSIILSSGIIVLFRHKTMETFLEFKVSKVNYFLQTIGIIVTFVKK
jgi:hypothetical protein